MTHTRPTVRAYRLYSRIDININYTVDMIPAAPRNFMYSIYAVQYMYICTPAGSVYVCCTTVNTRHDYWKARSKKAEQFL
jgi:hypothetical protein